MRYRWDPPYPTTSRRAGADDSSRLRASDAERNEVTEKLSRHFADGRLDQAEFKTRLDRAMGAVTRGDLDGLFDDLPRLADEPAPPRPRRRLFRPAVVLMVLAAVAASVAVSTVHLPWLLIVLRPDHRLAPGRAPTEPDPRPVRTAPLASWCGTEPTGRLHPPHGRRSRPRRVPMTISEPATAPSPDPSAVPAARAVDLVKTYGKGDAVVRALDGITLDLARAGSRR